MNNSRVFGSTAAFRNFIFGVEDSLVSTVGLVSGIAIGGLDRKALFMTGIVLIFVEAVSMAAGSYLSESSAAQFDKRVADGHSGTWQTSTTMFISYFFAGFIPLSPYLLFSTQYAFWASILASLISLFLLGVLSGRITGESRAHQGLKMLLIGGLAIGVGVLVGHFLKVT